MNRKEYFEKYLEGTASETEKELVAAWVTGLMARAGTGDATEEEQYIVKEWLNQENKASPDIEEVEKRKIETRSLLEHEYLSVPKRKKHTVLYRYAAAAILFAFGISMYFIYQPKQEKSVMAGLHFPAADSIKNSRMVYHTSSGSPVRKIQLPDSSFIYLNANTMLSVDSGKFNIHTRDVVLDRGEAFFQVTKNSSQKFTVQFGALQLEVHGTSFNIENYAHTHEKRVFVKTGKVIIKNAEGLAVALAADETFIYHTLTKKYIVKQKENVDVSQWINGKLVFAGAGLDEIKQKLKDRFEVSIETENNALPQTMQLNATFDKDDHYDKVAKVIAGIYGARYRIDNRRIIFY
ncbi:MAG: FecR domain-containing protein [Niabella sp.]